MKLKRKGGPAKRETGCSKFSLFLVFEIEILRLCSILLIRRGGEVPSRRARSDAYHRSAEKHRNIFSFPFSFFPPSLPMQHYALHQPLLPFLSKILLHDQTDISPVIKYNLKFLSKKKNYTKNDRARWSQESHLEISILLLRITIVNRKIRENKRCPDSIRPIREHRASSSIAPSSGEARSTRAQFADATALSTQP